MSSMGEEYPKEQARVREILGHYKAIGPAGAFGAAWIEEVLKRADLAAMSGDVLQVIRSFQEMQAVEE